MYNLSGKIAAITGIGGPEDDFSNGKAISCLLAAQGAHIEGLDINQRDGAHTQAKITDAGGSCTLTLGDATSEADINKWIENIIAKHGRIDILVNNVGQSERMSPEDADTDVWQKQFALNLDAAFMASRATLPHMKAMGGGAIVNISSVAGIRYLGKPQIAYSAAKAALQHYTKSSAVIMAPHKVRMNCVLPGLMMTPMVTRMAEKYAGGDLEGFIATRNGQVPMGVMGTAHDVANAVLFLVADESHYITGAEIIVDGGVTATIPR